MILLTLSLGHQACGKAKAWTDPDTAAKENPDFTIQGEYVAEGAGLQVVAIGGGKFLGALFEGGLPGEGAKSTEFIKYEGSQDEGVLTLEGAGGKTITVKAGIAKGNGLELCKTDRKSPTLGQKAPAGAVYLFNSESGENAFTPGRTRGKYLAEGQVTKDSFQDFHLHIEFRTPYKPDVQPGNQDRGNSGVYIFNNYETQVLDSFGIKAEFNFCGSLYRTRPPDVNMCFPPLSWQTYDIHFTAPRFNGKEKVRNARITTIHNGVTIHDDVELPKGTGAGGKRPEKQKSQIYLQSHGNPVSYNNIWLLAK
jgi:hypothetical protein